MDLSYGGPKYYCEIPSCAVAELTRTSFKLLQVLQENYPGKGYEYSTRWYYYVFSKD